MLSRRRNTQQRIDLSVASDQMLLELTRDGVSEAFGELWSRHSGAVMAATRSFTGYDPEELTQEAFLKVYSSVQAGTGELPASFRAYVAVTSRRLAIDRSRQDRGVVNVAYEEELDQHWAEEGDFSDRVIDDSTTSQAFQALPTRQREALWYRDVEDLPVQEIARYLGMSPNSTTVLIKRARDAFKTAWIGVQLSPARELPAGCAAMVPKIAGHSRGKLGATEQAKVDTHLLDCTHCAALSSEAGQLHKKLALSLLPLLLLGGAPAYSAWIQSKENRTPLPAAANEVEVAVQGIRRLPGASGAGAGVGAAIGALAAHSGKAFAALTVASLLALGASTTAGLLAAAEAEGDVAPVAPMPRGEPRSERSTGHAAEALLRGGDATSASNAEGASATHPGGVSVQPVATEQSPFGLEAQPERSTSPSPQAPGGASDPTAPGTPVDPGGSGSSSGPGDPADPEPPAYATPQPLAFNVQQDPYQIRIAATPGARIAIYLVSSRMPAMEALLTADSSGAVSYDFPQHRGKVVTGNIIQRYATATGEVEERIDLGMLAVPLVAIPEGER